MTQEPEKPIQRYHKMSGSDLSRYWLDAYGWIACYFAQLESLSYALLDLLCRTEDKAQLKKLPFQARTEQARAFVCDHLRARGEAVLADDWNALHDQDTGIVLVHEPDQPELKLGTVQEFAKSMLELNMRMQDLLTRSQLIDEQNSGA